MKRSKYWSTFVDILDNQFPKHQCKERGNAIVMLAYIEMALLGFEFKDGLPIKKEVIKVPKKKKDKKKKK